MLRPPSPNVHDHAVTLPVVVLLKMTLSGAVPEEGDALKLATGAGVGVGAGLGMGAGPVDRGGVEVVPVGTVNVISPEWGLSFIAAS